MRVRVPAWVIGVGVFAGSLYLFCWLIVAYPAAFPVWVPFTGFLSLMGIAAGGVFVMVSVSEGAHVPIPIPWPARKGKSLEKRLERVRETKWEVEGLLADPLRFGGGGGIRRDSPHATAIKARIRELETAEELIKVEMAYEALGKLDKKAAKVIRKELGR